MILVDTNVLLDVVTDDPTWADWSQRQLEMASLQGALVINPVIYPELSMAFARIECWKRSRAAVKRNVQPNFFIGAHAALRGMPILTRDVGRHANYFPTVTLLHPRG
ncbi:MAG: hypothetical protein MUF56_08800 [Solirubrobacteraceae bacterium]|nr:hypothetical protein [Solirubrobacteraceae bacterium]